MKGTAILPGQTDWARRGAGMLFVVLSAAAFGTLGILGRYAYAAGLDTFTILFLRFSLSAGVLALLLAARREPLPRGRVLLHLAGMGAVGYVGQAFSYLTALKYASPGLVALLLYLYPVFVALLSALWLGERITRSRAAALALALAGTALTVGPGSGRPLGILLAILAAAIYSVYIIVGAQAIKQVSAIQSSAVIFAAAGASSGALMQAAGPHLPTSGSGWLIVGLLVLIATVLPVGLFLAGLVRVGPTNAAMLSTLEPVVTVMLSALLLGETLSPATLLGGGMILAAALLLARSELRRN